MDGGKASSGPPIGPALGPTGVNMRAVIDTINKKTADFKGLKVPVVITVNPEDRSFEIKVKTPMTSALLFKEAGVSKGSGKPNEEKIADLTLEQIKKVARMKRDDLNAATFADAVRTVLGTAVSCGITVEGMDPKEVQKKIKSGEIQIEED
ncbi:MAG: 50S ribosomal protein L11 [Promethearchaeota archaeon]